MSGVAGDWVKTSIGEICEFKYGKSLPASTRSGGSTPVYGSNGIVGGHDEALTAGPTIVIGRKGSYGEVNFSPVSCWPIDTTYYVDSTATKVDLRWLALRLTTAGLNQMNRAAAVPGLNRDDAYRVQILLPPLPEQRRIAAILDQADTLRTQRRAALAQLDSLTQSLFLDMFGDPVTNPKGWLRFKLGDLIATGPQNGLYKPSTDYGSGTPILRIDAFYDGAVTKLNSLKRVRLSPEEATLFGLACDDIVINRVNSIEYLGKSAIIPPLPEPTVFESNMMRFSVQRDRVDPGFVVQFLQTPYVKAQILSGSKNAVNQSSINQQDVKSFLINVPPLPLQKTFTTRIQAIEALKAQHRAALAAQDALFAALQQRAFAGGL